MFSHPDKQTPEDAIKQGFEQRPTQGKGIKKQVLWPYDLGRGGGSKERGIKGRNLKAQHTFKSKMHK